MATPLLWTQGDSIFASGILQILVLVVSSQVSCSR